MVDIREDCGRESCPVMYFDNPSRWCRACLLRTVERAKEQLNTYRWELLSREHLPVGHGGE